MRSLRILGVISALVLLVPQLAVADDVRGTDVMICASVEATVCSLDGCEIGTPWFWGIPQFVEIDLKAKQLSTTAASGENRATPFKSLERKDGLIFLQGVENGRAFSFVITEETGVLSAAVAREELTVSVFGACTPLSR
jgi:hypothetical protein